MLVLILFHSIIHSTQPSFNITTFKALLIQRIIAFSVEMVEPLQAYGNLFCQVDLRENNPVKVS